MIDYTSQQIAAFRTLIDWKKSSVVYPRSPDPYACLVSTDLVRVVPYHDNGVAYSLTEAGKAYRNHLHDMDRNAAIEAKTAAENALRAEGAAAERARCIEVLTGILDSINRENSSDVPVERARVRQCIEAIEAMESGQ